MREGGLEDAIRAAGGIGALARRLGISQPSVSNWQRVPAERVVAVEALTGVPRASLRPDLYGTPASTRSTGCGRMNMVFSRCSSAVLRQRTCSSAWRS
jgi:DNA-binding transcriptional regulator YdaS (Cro superfamily)